MSDSKTDSTQLDGLDKDTSGFDEGASASDKSRSKANTAKAKSKQSAAKSDSKERLPSASMDGFSSVRRVWPD